MSSSQAIAVAPHPLASGADIGSLEVWSSEVPNRVQAQPPPGILSLFGKDSPVWKPYLEALQPPALLHFVVDLKDTPNRVTGGYAAVENGGGASAAKTSSSTGTSTQGEWGFLNDSKLSLEEKLFRFIKLIQKKTDQELEKKMKEYREVYGSSSTSSSSSSGSSTNPLESLFSGKWVKSALEEVGGLLGKAGAAALGVAPLGTVFGSIGEKLGGALADALGVKSGSSSSGSSSTTKTAGSPDERLDMLEIQRLVEKQRQMFDCVSNILRVIHETAMNTVGNLR